MECQGQHGAPKLAAELAELFNGGEHAAGLDAGGGSVRLHAPDHILTQPVAAILTRRGGSQLGIESLAAPPGGGELFDPLEALVRHDE